MAKEGIRRGHLVAILVVWALLGGLVALVAVTILANPPTPGVETPVVIHVEAIPIGWLAGALAASLLFPSIRDSTWGRIPVRRR